MINKKLTKFAARAKFAAGMLEKELSARERICWARMVLMN